jgi:uncharacterized cupredoxin-like copper-binding protein
MRKLVLIGVMAAVAAALAIPAAFGRSDKTIVAVKLKEFKVLPAPISAKAGPVAFKVKNVGALAHEFVIVKTNLPPGKLPVKANRVTLKPLGKIGPFQPGKGGALVLSLKAGKYVLYCNVAGHYKPGGQYAAFVVK